MGIAAPVSDHRGERVAAVLLSAPRFRVAREQLATIGEATVAAAREVEAWLGGLAEPGD